MCHSNSVNHFSDTIWAALQFFLSHYPYSPLLFTDVSGAYFPLTGPWHQNLAQAGMIHAEGESIAVL